MKNREITEIQITPVKPKDGLVGFASFVLFDSLYCSSVGIFTKSNGSYRLVYPTKKLPGKDIDLFHPISRELGALIEQEVSNKFEEVMKNDRYSGIGRDGCHGPE